MMMAVMAMVAVMPMVAVANINHNLGLRCGNQRSEEQEHHEPSV
jgi:hypothetical protein